MSNRLDIRPGLAIPLSEITIRSSRSSGPGGQHANVTASRVEVVFDVAASTTLSKSQKARINSKLGATVKAVSQDSRSQTHNRALALERLAAALEAALERPKPRRATKPTRASKERRLKQKKARAQTKSARKKPQED